MLVFALLVSVTAASVNAAEGRVPFLKCGIKWGSADSEQTTQEAFRKPRDDRDSPVVKGTQYREPEPVAFKPAGSGNTRRGRLPMSFTVAEFHCSWR